MTLVGEGAIISGNSFNLGCEVQATSELCKNVKMFVRVHRVTINFLLLI